jgi:hypothetical protein
MMLMIWRKEGMKWEEKMKWSGMRVRNQSQNG